MEDKSYSLAVFIDYENLALGTGKRDPRGHQRPGPPPQMNKVLERLVEKGRINVKRAYCDWQRFSGAVTPLHELGIELIEIPDRAHTGKNSADIRLSVDAMEVCFTKEHIDVFVICSGDSDFSPLVAKLKEHGKHVIGVGMKEATSSLLVHNCDEFIYYEDIGLSLDAPEYRGIVPADKEEVYRLLFTTVEALNRENIDRMQASLIKDAMRRKRPEFSESNYGYRNFTQLLQEAERYGFIVLSMDKLSGTWCVEGFNSQPVPAQTQSLVNRYSSYKSQRNTYGSYRSQQNSSRTRKHDVAENAEIESVRDEALEQETKKRASSLLRTRKLRKRNQDGQDMNDTAEDHTSSQEVEEPQEQVVTSHSEHQEKAEEGKLLKYEEDMSSEDPATTSFDQSEKGDKPAPEQKKPARKRSTRKKVASQPETDMSTPAGQESVTAEQESVQDEQASNKPDKTLQQPEQAVASDEKTTDSADQDQRQGEQPLDKNKRESAKPQRSRRTKKAAQAKDASDETAAHGEDKQDAPHQDADKESAGADTSEQPSTEKEAKPKRASASTRKRATPSKRTTKKVEPEVQAETEVQTEPEAQTETQVETDTLESQKPVRKTRSRKKPQPSDASADQSPEVQKSTSSEGASASSVGGEEPAAAPAQDTEAAPAKKTRRTTRKKSAKNEDTAESTSAQEATKNVKTQKTTDPQEDCAS